MCTCGCENKHFVEPKRYSLHEDTAEAVINLLARAKDPKISFSTDIVKMKDEALEETIKCAAEAYRILTRAINVMQEK